MLPDADESVPNVCGQGGGHRFRTLHHVRHGEAQNEKKSVAVCFGSGFEILPIGSALHSTQRHLYFNILHSMPKMFETIIQLASEDLQK